MKRLVVLLIASMCLATTAHAADVRIVTWNAKELFTPDDAFDRAGKLADFVAAAEPDILILQEITSLEVAEAFNVASGLNAPHVACSDFVQNPTLKHSSFEVAILSKIPLDQVIEFDPSPDNEADDPAELRLQALTKIGIEEVGTSRAQVTRPHARFPKEGWSYVCPTKNAFMLASPMRLIGISNGTSTR